MVNTDTREKWEKMEKANSGLTRKNKKTNGACLALLRDPRKPKINGFN